MKKDIETRADIEHLLVAFYKKAFADDLIGHFFTTVVPLDLDTHIPVIANFWESVLFHTQNYRKNVMEVHQHIHSLEPIHKEQLDRWAALFTQTVNEQFEGEKAELIKQRAVSIATIMNMKLNYNPLGKK